MDQKDATQIQIEIQIHIEIQIQMKIQIQVQKRLRLNGIICPGVHKLQLNLRVVDVFCRGTGICLNCQWTDDC